MLLTNHGWMQHRICDPKFEHPRTYWAQVEHIPTQKAIAQLQQGVVIKGYRTKPAQVTLLSNEPDLATHESPQFVIAKACADSLARANANRRQKSSSSTDDRSCGISHITLSSSPYWPPSFAGIKSPVNGAIYLTMKSRCLKFWTKH